MDTVLGATSTAGAAYVRTNLDFVLLLVACLESDAGWAILLDEVVA